MRMTNAITKEMTSAITNIDEVRMVVNDDDDDDEWSATWWSVEWSTPQSTEYPSLPWFILTTLVDPDPVQ